MGEARFRSRGSCGVFAPAEVLSPVERAEERLDVPRVPGFEPLGQTPIRSMSSTVMSSAVRS